MTVRVQEQAFDLGAEVQAFALGRDDAGAVVSFTGIVRNTPDGNLERMEMEHYPGMTENALKGIEAEAMKRWNLKDCLIIHRYGTLRPGDLIMMVATSSPHRGDAFEAAMFLMDYLKSRAPFWKKEYTTDGAEWVAAKDEDEDALTKW
ncbi:molybdenum cofactor biosynthesis protein MoaE [Profundibacter sp.]|uniref:molybdenum cofactor biosynthesis protein MoaE n=1 Tax=Profundibacter sp. TaxID=3101071 RepID=UPI003D0E7FFF